MFEWGKLRDTACVAAGHTSTVVVLLDAGSSVDKTDEAGWTALSIAAARGHDSTMAALLGTAGGANVDARNRNMTTALIACAALDTCRSDILVFLLEAVRTVLYCIQIGKTRPLSRLKTIILPRQAWDKHQQDRRTETAPFSSSRRGRVSMRETRMERLRCSMRLGKAVSRLQRRCCLLVRA
jgi:ankyrin repeat protein